MGGPHASGAQDVPAGFQGFVDRRDAGRQLADLLCSYRGQDALVMGIPRGGVAVAVAVSRLLGVDLDVLVSRKVGVPIEPELALGAVTADGPRFMNQALARETGVSRWMFRVLADEQRAEARRREQRLRGRRPAPHLAGRTVILVDDGLATGATMRAAIRSVRQAGPARLVIAVPVAAQPTCEALRLFVSVAMMIEASRVANYGDTCQRRSRLILRLLEPSISNTIYSGCLAAMRAR
jgi:putative phosphoribosyl transferase